MKKEKMKLKRTATVMLVLALVWMFLLPVQAFAEETVGEPVLLVETEGGDGGSGDGGSGDGAADPDAAEEEPSENTAETVPPGSAYLAPDTDILAAEKAEAESAEEDKTVDPETDETETVEVDEPAASEPTEPVEPEPTETEPAETEPVEAQNEAVVSGVEEWTHFENTESGNAIQQAVDAAIAAGQKYITVVVQDGTYTGGLNIDNSGVDEDGNAKESIVVNIIAHDAYEHGETPIVKEDSGIDTADAEDDTAGEGESASTSEVVYPVPINDDGTVDTAAINTGSAGGVKLEGGVSVKNVELLLAGIYLSLKEQQENKEETKSETGTAEENNQDIKVEDADNFHYYGTSQSDTVNISLTDVTKATIDTGAGDDVMDVNTTTSPNVELDTDKEDSVLSQEFEKADSVNSEVSISSGSGNDKITVTETSAVTDEDNVVSVRKGQNKLTVDAGDGADTVTLKGDSGLTDIKKNISEAIANKVYAIVSMGVSGHESIAEIKGGEDDDLLNLDTSFELGTMGQTVVNYQGEAGKNRLHFTGTLAPVEDNVYGNLDPNGSGKISMYSKNTVSKTEYSLIDKNLWFNKNVTELDLQSSNALKVMMSGVDSLTDDLKGKKTVEITFDNGKVMTKDENGNPVEVSFKAFTDYVYDPDEDTVSLVSFSNDSGSRNPGLLIKLIVKGENLTVGEDVVIDIPGVTLMMESINGSLGSGSILIEGQMKAENIMLKLASSDSFGVSFLEKDEETDAGFNFGLMDVNTTGTITIASTAQLIAARVVDILAKTIQSNGLLPDLSGLSADKIDGYIEKAFGFKGLDMLKQAASINFVSVKMASAFVEILGSIVANSVRVSANSKVNANASNSALRDIGLPFALSVILGEAGIKVSGDQASITADHDIYLDATSDITVNTTAMSGRLPFTVAVAVVDNDAYVDISGGKLVSTNGNIIANATGTVNLKTAAAGSNVRPNNNAVVPSTDHQASNTATQVEMGKSGGFFAISVLNQDVFSALKGTASAIAKGDITVNSTAKASVVNQAASNPGEDGESLTLVKMLKMMAGTEEVPGEGGTVTKIIGKVTSYFNGKKNQAQSKEEKEEAAKKNGAFSNFLDKITGNGKDSDGDDVGSLVDKATTSANTGKNDSTNSVQMVGAVAVTYANNNNKAYIETDGEVRADGKLSVLANGELKVETLADGSPVKADDPAGGDEKTEPKDQHYDAHKHGIVKVDALTNGTILIGAYIGEGDNGTFEVVDNKSNIKIKDPTPFKFVVKAVAGYKLKADENGKYWITNEYKRDSDNSKQTEQIEVELVGKDADGCYLYKCNSYQVFNGDNLFKAEFVPKQHSLTVENNAEQLGKVEFSHTQQDGKQMQSADHEEMVYVTVNIKSGVTFATPVITYISDTYDKAQPFDALELIDKDGNVVKDKLSDVMDKIGDVQKDGTTNYYYRFKMPNGKVTMAVNFTGDDMNIKLDLEDTADRNSDVWITAAENDSSRKLMEKDSVYAGKVGDKVKIVIKLSEKTYLVKNSLKFAGKTPVYIKDITDNGNGQYTCFVNIPAILKTEGDSTAANDLKLTFQTTVDAKEAQGTVQNTSTSLGAGLAVDVTRYNNQAYIANAKNNTITSGSVEVKADTADLSASAVSKAGYVAGDVGVAGAITVHLVSANNEALIGGDMHTVNVSGGDLVVDSMIQNSNIVTKADAAGDGADGENTDRDSVGVGAGIAVGVTNLAVVSRILDSVAIGGKLGNLNINAGHTGSESMSAAAGAAGGTSVVPVLALNISGVSVLADSGKLSGNLLTLAGDAVIKAANSITRTITADAAAVGSGVGVGASFIIDILNDSAKANLGRRVKTNGNVTVSADSVSRLNATAKSGAQGSVSGEDDAGDSGGSGNESGTPGEEPPPSGGSDELPDDYYEGLDNLFGENGADDETETNGTENGSGTKNAEPEEEEDPESLAPLFRESEADAFVDSNKESAKGLSGLVENDNGNVTSENVGDAFEKRQKAETSEGSVQVAATMVLNIQKNAALAQIDIDAVNSAESDDQGYSIEAGGKVSVTSHHDTDGIIMANASATKSTTGVGVAVAINTVTYSNIAAILTDKITAGEIVVRASVSEEAAKEKADGFLEAVKKEMLGDEGKIKAFVDGLLEASGKGDLNTYIRNALKDLDIELAPEGEDSILSETVALICKWVEELLQGQNPSFPNENEEDEEVAADNDDQEDEEPETISEEEPDITNTQVAQFAKVVFNKVKDVFSNENLRKQIFSGEFLKNLKKEIKDLNLKEKITSAVVGYLAGKLGPSAEEPEFVGPKISTSAVSGAGAANVGVAGSVAISVVNGTSSAYIADANNGNMTVIGGNITVESKASQDVYTSAGASVDALGRVDKNKDDTDTANSTQGDASDKDVGTAVGVGAAVAMSFADLTSDAGIGSGWKISARDLLMNSEAENNVETTSVSGTDPLARTEEPTDKKEEDKKEEDKKEKDASEEKSEEEKKAEEEEKAAKSMNYAVDASVSVTLIQNVVKSYLAQNSVITLAGNLNMLSAQSGETNTNASGYAMGNDTAVGAAVAINLAFSDVLTQVLGSGTVAGSASLDSRTENQDDATAMALAMGAEMERYFAKIRNAEKVKAFNKKKEEENKKDEKIENETGNKISDQLKRASKVSEDKEEEDKNDSSVVNEQEKEEKDKSNPSQPLSVQALKSQNVKTESTNQTDSDKNTGIGNTVTDATDANTGDAVSGTMNEQAQEGQSIHVAASVGVNVTQHSAKTEIKGNLTAGGLKAEVENTGVFSTASTGAAISNANNSNCVGAAVAVSVNGNKALIEIPDGIKIVITGTPAEPSTDPEEKVDPILGNVALSTVLNQNSTDDGLGRYGALAVSGSSSGKGGKVGLAGSVAVMVAKGTSAIILGDVVSITGTTKSDGNTNPVTGSVTIAASDKSKLSAAAMAATKSGGATAGVGASFALLYAENTVLAQAGDQFTVNAGSFGMTATKQAVTIKDFDSALSAQEVLTVIQVDSEGNGGYTTDDADKYGMIVLQKNKDGSYTAFTNLNSGNILDVIQMTSLLASVNYYASAVAGTVMERKGDTSNQKAAVAGAVSMLFNNSVTGASIGKFANIKTSGAAEITASSNTNTRLLGGALSSSGAKAGIGLNVATAKQKDQVYATLGNKSNVVADSFRLASESISDMLVITAAAVNSSGTSVGGGLNVVINDTSADASVGYYVTIHTKGSVEIDAKVDSDVILGSVTVALADGTNQGASVGAIVSVTTNASSAQAVVGNGVAFRSDLGSITISAINEEMVINVLAAAARSGDGGAGAGTLSVLTTNAKAIAGVGEFAQLTAKKDVQVSAKSKAKLVDLMLAAAASTDAPAVGATIMVNVFNRETGAYIGENCVIVTTNGNVLVQSDSEEKALILSIAGAAASQNAISGNIQVNVGNSETYATIGDNAKIKAWDSIGVTANQDSTVVAISPTLSYGQGSTAVGATVQTNILSTRVEASIGDGAKLIAYAQPSATNGVQTANRETKRKGIILSALAKDLVVAGGVSASAGSNAIAGVVETLVNKTIVLAKLGANAVVKAGFTSGDTVDSDFSRNDAAQEEGELTAEADAHSKLYLFGGAFSASSSTGVGATVLTLVYDKNVDAQISLSTQEDSDVRGNVNVIARTEDVVALISVNFGVSNSTAVNAGGNVLIFQNAVNAKLSGNLLASGDVTVQADNITNLVNAIASVSGSLGGTAVSGAALVTYFQGSTTAYIDAGSTIDALALYVLATSTANIHSDGVGLTVSGGSAAVSGLVNIIVTSTETEAYVASGCQINAKIVSVIATDNYDLLAVAASLSGGKEAVGVTAVVTVAKNTVHAYIGQQSVVQSDALTVQAVSNRNIRNYAGSVAAGATAGVGVTVMVAVIGGKLDQDSANGIAKDFNPNAFMTGMQSSVPNAAKGYLDNADLSEDLASDDSKASDLHVGENGNYNGTDGYRSEDFKNQYTSGTNPGENFNQNVTNTQGSELGMAKPAGEYTNVVHAYIGSGCDIIVATDALIEAAEKLNVDIVTASAAIGGTAGVNVGVAVVVAYSNVLAEIQSGTVLDCEDVTVRAVSGGDGSIANDKASEILNKAGINAATEGSSIRAIAITVGVGATAGVSPSVAVVNMASSAIAKMDGVSGSAGILTVKAEMLYPNVLAVTGAVGAAGIAGVSASVAVVTFNSKTYAGIINSGALTADGINILSNVDNTAKAYAMSLAGGAVGVNGGVAVVTNRSTTNTILGTGVYVISSNADISSNVNTNAESFIVGVSLGGVAVGLNAAVVNQDATIVTQILGNAASNLTAAGDVTVSNDVTSTAKSTVIAVVGGGIGVGGNVLLVFNNMDATAAIDKMPFDVTGIVAVYASMKADAEANLASATVGVVSVGLSTSYVGLNAENLAYLELLQGMKAAANAILVYACKANEQNSFNATASTVAGSAGVSNVNLNAAVADINASNEAKILSYGTIEGSVYVQADSQAAALAEIYFVALGGVNAFAATAVSLLRINQLAEANITTLDNFETLIVASLLNDDSATVPSHAKLVTVSGGMYNANANVAVAYSLSKNIAKAILHTGTRGEGITVYAGGAADAKSETLNQSGGAFSGSVYVNVAYAKGQFQSLLEVLDQVTATDVAVQTVYTTNANANLTPSASKFDFSAVKFNVNLAIAKAAAEAIAKIYGSGEMILGGDLKVIADSSNSSAIADIVGAKATFSGATFGTNIADAQMMLNQSVIVKDVSVSAEGIILVSSRLNNLSSTAETGSNVGIKMTLIGGDVNTANAGASVQNKVELENATLSAREALSIEALCDKLSVNARAKAVTANISGFNAAVTRTYAKLSSLINYVDIKTCDELSGSTVNVTASSKETKVIAQSSVPRTNASLIGFMSIAATAEIVDKQTYIHIDASKILSNIGDVVLSSFSDAIMKADSAHPSTSIGALIVNDYRFNVIVRNSLSEVTNNGNIISAQNVHITAYDNIVADIQMTDRTIAGFSHNNAVAKINVVNQKAYIHADGTIEAMNDIILLAKADQTLQCTVITDSKNFKDSGYVTTEVLLNRTATVDVSGDLTSQEGNIDIRALLDDRDNNSIIRVELKVNVDTWLDGSDYPRATGKVTSTAIARVKSGADLQANNLCASDKGNVTILAKSAGNMLVKTVRTMNKVFGQNASFATAEMKETVRTDIGENGGKATISGRNVDISAQSDMSVVSEAYSYTYVQLGLTFKPTATTVFCSDIDTTVNGADIKASELLSVSAYLPFARARAYAYALKDWLIGYNAPSATVKGNIYTDVLFYTNSSLSAKNINVKAFSPTDKDSNVRIERIEEWHHWSNNGEKVTSFNTTEAAKKTGSSLNTYLKEKLFIPGTYKSNVTDEKNVYFCGNVLWSQPSSNPNSSNKTDVSLAENTAAVTITISKDDRVSISGFKSGVVYGDIVNHITSGNSDVYEILGDRVRELAAVTTTTGKVSVKAYSHRNSYNTFTDTTLSKLDVTIRNDSDSDLLLNNLNEAESFSHVNGGSELVVIMTNSGSETGKAPDLIFNSGGDYSHGKIHVTLSGGNMRLENGAQIKARNITVLDAGSIMAVDENGNPVDLVFTNSGYTGNAADSSINLQVKEALNLILKTSNSSYVIDRIQTGGDLVLKVENVYGKDKPVAVILGELISGGDVTLTVPYSVESAKSDEVNISGDGIYLTAGGAVGTSNRFLRIDSSVNQIRGITVTAFGGIYLKEVSGDLYINQIANLGTGNIAIWTENGSIHSDPAGTSDNLEDLDRYMMLYAEAGVMCGNAGDMIHVLLQYLSDLLRIQEALQTKGEEVLEIVRKEIDILHDVTSVETALAIIQDELRYIGGEEYQNPEIGHALMNGAVQGEQLTDAFNAEVDRLAKDENATIGGELGRYLVIWRDNQLEMAEYLQNAVNCYKAALANSIHIFGSGDLHLHLQSSNGTASVSKDINSLSLSVGGKVTITTAQNTVLKDVYLESYDALTLDPIVATDVIDLYSLKGIFAAKNSNQVLLDANELVLRSLLEGNLGTAKQTLILNTNLLDALGNYVYLENRKDLVVDMVIALEDLYLTVKGNVNDQHDDDVILNGIHGNNITLNVSGDIGRADDSDQVVGFERQDENVTIVSDNSLNITARNLYMAGHGNILIGSIHTDGMTSINVVNGSIMNAAKGSGIWCDSLKLYAYGMIGTPEDPLEIHSNGIYSSGGGGLMRSLFRARAAENTEENSPKQDTLMADSYLYGENIRIIPLVSQNVGMHTSINVALQNLTVTDSGSGIRVTGAMGKGAVLIVSDISDHTDDICKLLMQHHQVDGRIFVNLKLLNNHTGNLTVQIPVTEELAEYEGREIVILTCRDGVIWAIRATVINGFITFCTEELGAFLIFGDPSQLVLTEDGTQIILAQQYLPFGGWL